MTRDVFKYFKHVRSLQEDKGAEKAAELGYQHQARGVYLDPKTQKRYKNVGDKLEPIVVEPTTEKDGGQQKPAGKTLGQFNKDATGTQPEAQPTALPQIPDGVSDDEFAAAKAKEFTGGRDVTPERKEFLDKVSKTLVALGNRQAAAEVSDEEEPETPEEEPKATEEPEKTVDDFPTLDDKIVEKEGEEELNKVNEVDTLMNEEPSVENIADLQDTMLELRKMTGKQTTDAIQKSETKYAKYMDKVFKPFEDLVNSMDEKKQNSFAALVANAHKFTGRSNNGAGLNSLGQFDVEQLALAKKRMFDNYDFDNKESVEKYVRSVRNNEVTDELVDTSFEILPKKLKQTWGKKGMAGKGELGKNHFLGYDKKGKEMRGQGGVDRAKYVWRMYLEQGGVDAYTGLPLNIDNIDLEHIRPASKAEGDLDEFRTREHEKNWVLVNSNVNQAKSDLTMNEFFEKQVDPLSSKGDDYWKTRSEIFDYRNSIPSKESELMGSFVDKDGNIVEGMTGEIFMDMMDNHEAGLKKTKKELGVGADASGDKEIKDAWKSIETQSKLAKELITTLGLPRGYNKQKNVEGSKPRSNSMGSDNYYRGVFLSIVGKSPEEQAKIKNTYRDAIRHAEDSGGGDASFASYMVENGGVDMERIGKYKSLSKMFKSLQESISDGRMIIENLKKSLRDPF